MVRKCSAALHDSLRHDIVGARAAMNEGSTTYHHHRYYEQKTSDTWVSPLRTYPWPGEFLEICTEGPLAAAVPSMVESGIPERYK